MKTEEALIVLDTVLKPTGLSDTQELVFRQSWEGLAYPVIAETSGYDANYIKEVGYKLWNVLSQALGEKVTKRNIHSVLRRWQSQQTQVGIEECGSIGSPPPITSSFHHPNPQPALALNLRRDWGEAIDVSVFYGRVQELTKLKQWIVDDRCRLVGLLGMGGMGKTALSVKLAEQIQDEFEFVVWRSLRSAPPIQELLVHLIQFLSNQQETEAELPKDVDSKISRLIYYLRSSRCLLVLDNAETILRSGRTGYYRAGYEEYGELLRRIGETRHQSCLVLTSREKPRELVSLEGETLPVRSLQLTGLKEAEGREIFNRKGSFFASESEWKVLIEHYAGNPLALKMVAACIQELFDRNISDFLESLNQRTLVFDDICDLLDRQFSRLSDLEKEIMYWLAIERIPVSLAELRQNILSPVSRQKLLEALRSLGQRSLTEKSTDDTALTRATGFTQQPVVMEYMTNRLIEQVCEEITTGEIAIFNSHALIKVQGKDYVRDTQIRLILKPVIDELLTGKTKTSLENQLTQIISRLRLRRTCEVGSFDETHSALEGEEMPRSPGYAAGNVLNLLCQLQTDLRGYDFSALTVWQAHLPGRTLKQVNFGRCRIEGGMKRSCHGTAMS